MRARSWCWGVVLGVAVALGTGCGEESVPTAMSTSEAPDFAVASRNAAVQFLRHVERSGGKVLEPQKAFSYSLSTFEDAAAQKALDRDAFARMFCDSIYVEKENTLPRLLILKRSWGTACATVHQKMQDLGFNLFIRWLNSGEMTRTGTAEPGAPKASGYQQVPAGDEEEASRNVARRILWMAAQSGIFPVPGKLDVETVARKVRTLSGEPAFKKIMTMEDLLRAFSDPAYLDYLVLDERMSQLVKTVPSEAFRQASATCVEQISRVYAVLEQGLVKRGYITMPAEPKAN